MKRFNVFLLLFCMSQLAPLACRTPLPQGVPLGGDDPRPERLLEEMVAQAHLRTALQGAARLSIDAQDLSFSRPQRMAVEKPGRLRVEVLGLFDQIAGLVVTRDRSFQFLDARTGRLEEGRVDPDILWRVARIDLSPEEAVDVILGVPAAQPGFRVAAAETFQEGRIAFDRVDGRGVRRERYVFDEAGRPIEVQRMGPDGDLVWRVRYSDFRPVDPSGDETISFAFEIEMDFPRVEARAKLAFKRVSLPASLPDALFVLPRRDSARPGASSDALARVGGEAR